MGHRSAQDIDAYTRLDMGLGWRFAKDLELDITAQNLLDNRHLEFSSYSTTSAEIPRSIYAKLTWSY